MVQLASSRHPLRLAELRRGEPMALDLSRSRVADVDLRVLAAFAHGGGALQSLSLARTRVGRDGVIAAIGVPSLTFLDVSGCQALASDAELGGVGEALLGSTTSKLGALKCDAFELAVGATMQRGMRQGMRQALAAAALAAGCAAPQPHGQGERVGVQGPGRRRRA